MVLKVRNESGNTPRHSRWGVDSETGVLRDLLVGPIDNYRWSPGNAVAERTERLGLKFDFDAIKQ